MFNSKDNQSLRSSILLNIISFLFKFGTTKNAFVLQQMKSIEKIGKNQENAKRLWSPLVRIARPILKNMVGDTRKGLWSQPQHQQILCFALVSIPFSRTIESEASGILVNSAQIIQVISDENLHFCLTGCHQTKRFDCGSRTAQIPQHWSCYVLKGIVTG